MTSSADDARGPTEIDVALFEDAHTEKLARLWSSDKKKGQITIPTNDEIKNHYTRMQILSLLENPTSLPDPMRLLRSITLNRNTDPDLKSLSLSSFLALSLVGESYGDVAAVSIEASQDGEILIIFTANKTSEKLKEHAEQMAKICRDALLVDRTLETFYGFRKAFLKQLLSHGSGKIRNRINSLAGHTDKTQARQMAKVARAFNIKDFMRLNSSVIPNQYDQIVREFQQRNGKVPQRKLARGDAFLMKSAQSHSLHKILSQYLDTLSSCISVFQKDVHSLTKTFDLGTSWILFTICDNLGSSELVEDILDSLGVDPQQRNHFTMSLRKVGAYASGCWTVWRALKKCMLVKNIEIKLIPAEQEDLFACHDDYWEFVLAESKRVLQGKTLSITESRCSQYFRMGVYKQKVELRKHAELHLVQYLMSVGKVRADIGISKECCAACTAALVALRKSDCKYDVHGGHNKTYLASLSGNLEMDEAIINVTKAKFEDWIFSLHQDPDSDTSWNNSSLMGLTEEDINELEEANSELSSLILQNLDS